MTTDFPTLWELHHQRAQSCGISRIYSIVSRGSASWTNMIRCGFEEAQNVTIFAKKEQKDLPQ